MFLNDRGADNTPVEFDAMIEKVFRQVVTDDNFPWGRRRLLHARIGLTRIWSGENVWLVTSVRVFHASTRVFNVVVRTINVSVRELETPVRSYFTQTP